MVEMKVLVLYLEVYVVDNRSFFLGYSWSIKTCLRKGPHTNKICLK